MAQTQLADVERSDDIALGHTSRIEHDTGDCAFAGTSRSTLLSAPPTTTFCNQQDDFPIIDKQKHVLEGSLRSESKPESSLTSANNVFQRCNEGSPAENVFDSSSLINDLDAKVEAAQLAAAAAERKAVLADLAAKARAAELAAAEAEHEYLQAHQSLQRQVEAAQRAKRRWRETASVTTTGQVNEAIYFSRTLTALKEDNLQSSSSHQGTDCLSRTWPDPNSITREPYLHEMDQTKYKQLLSSQSPEKRGAEDELETCRLNTKLAKKTSNASSQGGIGRKGPRPKDMPRHPLTAYNFFFSDERERIIRVREKAVGDHESSDEDPVQFKLTVEEKQKKLVEYLDRRREQKSKRRPHRKTHGKISFKELATLIAQRWRNLSTDRLAYYHELAEMDMANYRLAMTDYKKRISESGTTLQANSQEQQQLSCL